ncbi:hypothetical protein V5799_006814 [Amblyomma americanum]|uniref:Lipocalin-6 1 n=1 Tax=Amblyomma americanum TaxID=6943 RepID=A0AAQ4DVB5_AMBAM
MTVVGTLIFFACVFKVFAIAPGAAPSASTETQLDGYGLLTDGRTFRLVQTTFHFQDNNTDRCITVTVKKKDDNNHVVTLEVEYYTVNQDTWKSYSQRFQFLGGGPKYNKMKKYDGSESPPGTYTFLHSDPDCTIIEVKDSLRPNKETVELRALDTDIELSQKDRGNCMLWVENTRNPDEQCFQKYQEQCPDLIVREGFSSTKCQKRPLNTAS